MPGLAQSGLDEHRRPVRDEDSTTYLATLADAAAWIWNLATKILPAATQIVDLYHAREHVHDIANAVAFEPADLAVC